MEASAKGSGSGSGSSGPAIDASRSASARAAAAAAVSASSSIERPVETTSVTRKPNSSSMTTTSPRAIGLPLISRSTGSPARRFSDTTEPGRGSSVCPMVMRVRPISTASSTGTSYSRRRSAPSAPAAVAGSRGMNSISSCTVCCSLLDGHVGEQDVVGLHIGMGLDLLEDFLTELGTALPAGQVASAGVGDRVGDHRADRGLLRQRAIALRRRGALATFGCGDLLLREHERDAQLREVGVGKIDQELLGQHVDGALELHLLLSRLGEHKLVATADDHEDHERDDELQLALHGVEPPCSPAAPSLERSKTISTRRLRERPAGVVLLDIG